MMSSKKEVIIVGAGAMGCSTAYHLAKRGVASHIIEKESIAARASGKAWAVISYPPLFPAVERIPDLTFYLPDETSYSYWLHLFWAGYFRMADLALDIKERGGIDIEFGKMPWTLITMTEEEEQEMKFFESYFKESGAHECEWTSADDLQAIFPSINPEIRGGLTLPQLQVEPYKYTLGLAQSAEAMGAEITQGEVVGFGTKGQRITSVKLASGKEIEADEFVIATGAHNGQTTSLLGTEIPVHPCLVECLRVRPPKGFPKHSLGGRRVEILSRVNGDITLAGSEDASRFDFFDGKGRPDLDATLSENFVERTLETAIQILPDLKDAELIEHRGDLLAHGPSPLYNKPALGRLPDWENGYIATEASNGIHMSVGIGQVLADLVIDGEVPYHVKQMLDHLRPRRAEA
jgi:glycine/D-amino acid oxidase-like deaminating enzyme